MLDPITKIKIEQEWHHAANLCSYFIIKGCDLLTEPAEDSFEIMNRKRLTQLLIGERVELIKQQGEWSQVAAYCQPIWSEKENKFAPYTGWLKTRNIDSFFENFSNYSFHFVVISPVVFLYKDPKLETQVIASLPLGSFLYCNSNSHLGWLQCFYRDDNEYQIGWVEAKYLLDFQKIAQSLRTCSSNRLDQKSEWLKILNYFESAHYVWGGLGLKNQFKDQIKLGIDCSGLIHVAARCMGRIVPRNAKDQYLWFDSIEKNELVSGDLIFLSNGPPQQIFHVLVVIDQDHVLESAEKFKGFKISSINSRLNELINDRFDFQKLGKDIYFFCRWNSL
jgi:hypothetical protein